MTHRFAVRLNSEQIVRRVPGTFGEYTWVDAEQHETRKNTDQLTRLDSVKHENKRGGCCNQEEPEYGRDIEGRLFSTTGEG